MKAVTRAGETDVICPAEWKTVPVMPDWRPDWEEVMMADRAQSDDSDLGDPVSVP